MHTAECKLYLNDELLLPAFWFCFYRHLRTATNPFARYRTRYLPCVMASQSRVIQARFIAPTVAKLAVRGNAAHERPSAARLECPQLVGVPYGVLYFNRNVDYLCLGWQHGSLALSLVCYV